MSSPQRCATKRSRYPVRGAARDDGGSILPGCGGGGPVSWIAGGGMTAYGKLPGRNTLDLMSEAASAALQDAQLERRDVDGLICGYSTTFPHLMLSTSFVEHFGLQPAYAH